ncbi:hypothetical protein P691DRAFT_125680 [Macrolepiota fuliginosa MF-IS2]|uniref:RING-type domain-containing protein n=1 Tax=Macrolepiota fuliginosa MF-IS2 TaxID=1400762 RepID=A0A9P6C159_9AGAR|nr:hypothetical protein P691DRAFT_125680 [Macrolepiota fuliginosa MF-IS2]
MLVLHPTSRCDVCLEPYASDSSPQAPHAIPCGHIFCKVCLDTVEPANCPLCRKPFMPDRVKNLHVDRPESADENREPELLEKLVMAWDAEEQELLVLLTQIEEWLNSKDEGENTALRKAVSVLAKFQKLKTRRVDDHRMIKRLKGQIADEDYQRATQSEESKAVELSLMHQIETLQSQLSRTQGEVVQLRVQTSRPGMSELNDLRK